MSRRLDIGVASYRNAAKLKATLESIAQQTVSDWRCFVVHNPAENDNDAREVIAAAVERDPRFLPVWMPKNYGYAGAINELLRHVGSDYIAYCDNDIEIQSHGWDERLCSLMDAHPEVGQVFPGSGHYGFFNGSYHECLWNAGYCWIVRRAALAKLTASEDPMRIGDGAIMDFTLGHHEEVDLMIRLRLAGFQIGCDPSVGVIHHETATNANAADHKPGGRIHDGVVNWMNKWNRHFCGDQLQFSMTAYDERALRYTDWPPCALYLERWVKAQFPDWNAAPRTVMTSAGPMDAIEILKPKGCYVGRAI